MFGKPQAIFRSRWRALFWASGVLLTAYCTVPSPHDDGQAQQQQQAPEDERHHNPWAIDPAKR